MPTSWEESLRGLRDPSVYAPYYPGREGTPSGTGSIANGDQPYQPYQSSDIKAAAASQNLMRQKIERDRKIREQGGSFDATNNWDKVKLPDAVGNYNPEDVSKLRAQYESPAYERKSTYGTPGMMYATVDGKDYQMQGSKYQSPMAWEAMSQLQTMQQERKAKEDRQLMLEDEARKLANDPQHQAQLLAIENAKADREYAIQERNRIRDEREQRKTGMKGLLANPEAFKSLPAFAQGIGQVDPEAGLPILVDQMMKKDTRSEGERATKEAKIPALLASSDPADRALGQKLSAAAGVDPTTYAPARTRITSPQDVVSQAPELDDKLEELTGAVAKMSMYGGGSREQAAAGQLARNELWALANEKARDYGANPRQLFRALEAELTKRIAQLNAQNGVGQSLGQSLSTLGGLMDDPRTKYANALLGQ